jgi:hypothetical protein
MMAPGRKPLSIPNKYPAIPAFQADPQKFERYVSLSVQHIDAMVLFTYFHAPKRACP